MGTSIEDVKVLKRLLRNAFSDILSLKGQISELQGRLDKQQSPTAVKGSLCLLNEARLGEVPSSTQCTLGLDFVYTEAVETRVEFTTTTCGKGTRLSKVAHRTSFFDGSLKFLFAPCGSTGDDIVPTLNPNAEQGLSRFVSKGCTIHQSCKGTAIGFNAKGRSGDQIAGGVFSGSNPDGSDEHMSALGGVIFAPGRDASFGLIGSWQAQNSGTGHPKKSCKVGGIGAVSLDNELIMAGWLCAERCPSTSFSLESYGVVLSSDNTSRRLGYTASKHRRGWKQTFEFSTNLIALSGADIYLGITTTVQDGHVSPVFGMRNVLKF